MYDWTLYNYSNIFVCFFYLLFFEKFFFANTQNVATYSLINNGSFLSRSLGCEWSYGLCTMQFPNNKLLNTLLLLDKKVFVVEMANRFQQVHMVAWQHCWCGVNSKCLILSYDKLHLMKFQVLAIFILKGSILSFGRRFWKTECKFYICGIKNDIQNIEFFPSNFLHICSFMYKC